MHWKRIVGICVFLIIAFMVAVYGVLATYDYNKLKPDVARMVKNATGRELRLAGEMKLAFGWSPLLEAKDVALANASWGSQPEMIKIETLRLQVGLLPLLLKKLELERIGLAGAEMLLESDAKGRRNWDLALADPSGKSVAKSGPFKLAIDHIRIDNLALVVRKAKAESATRMTIARLDLARQASGDTQTVDLQSEFNGQPVEVSGTTASIHELLVHPRFPLRLAGKIATTAFTIDGVIEDILDLTGIDLVLNGSGRNLAEIGPIIGQKLPATDKFALKGRLTGSAKALSLKDAQGSASRGSLRLTLNGAVQNFLTLGGMDLASMLSGKNLTEFGEIIGVKLVETDEFEIQGRLTGDTDALALQAAKASAGRGSMRLSLTGAVEDLLTLEGMDLQSRLSGRELAEIGPLVGADLPDLGSFDVQGKLTGSPQALSLKPLTAIIDKSDFKGQAAAAFLKRPKFTVRLDSSVIDFTALMTSLEKDAQKPAKKEKPKRRLFSDEPLPLETLSKVDADIVLQATNIHARNARFETGHLALKLEDRDFSIDKLEATYKGTKISGNLHIEHGEMPHVATEFLVQNFNLGDFLKETGKSDEVRAVIDIAAHGQSRGNSVSSLMANLDGAIGVVMGEGYLTHYLDILSAGLSEKVIQFWHPPKAIDQIKCAIVQFDIKEGVAASRAFVFNTRVGIIDGEGEINLGNEKIDFLLMPKSKHPELRLVSKLKVSGTVMDPQVGVAKLSLLASGAEGLSSLVIGPLGLLAPFAHLGAHNKHPCDVKGVGQGAPDIPAEEQAPSP